MKYTCEHHSFTSLFKFIGTRAFYFQVLLLLSRSCSFVVFCHLISFLPFNSLTFLFCPFSFHLSSFTASFFNFFFLIPCSSFAFLFFIGHISVSHIPFSLPFVLTLSFVRQYFPAIFLSFFFSFCHFPFIVRSLTLLFIIYSLVLPLDSFVPLYLAFQVLFRLSFIYLFFLCCIVSNDPGSLI